MPRHRHSRLITVLFALFSLLFMQLAVAGYVCPASMPPSAKMANAAEVVAMSDAGMPCAQSMRLDLQADEAQPQLCQSHCQAGQQTADRYQPTLPPALDLLPAGFTLVALAPLQVGPPLQAPHLARTTAPPVSIRHCCLRL